MNKIPNARKAFREAFKKDDGFREMYIANIACCLHDNNSRDLSWRECNELADKLLDLIFNS